MPDVEIRSMERVPAGFLRAVVFNGSALRVDNRFGSWQGRIPEGDDYRRCDLRRGIPALLQAEAKRFARKEAASV